MHQQQPAFFPHKLAVVWLPIPSDKRNQFPPCVRLSRGGWKSQPGFPSDVGSVGWLGASWRPRAGSDPGCEFEFGFGCCGGRLWSGGTIYRSGGIWDFEILQREISNSISLLTSAVKPLQQAVSQVLVTHNRYNADGTHLTTQLIVYRLKHPFQYPFTLNIIISLWIS